ncbi:Zinc finger CCCH domain-containing protein 30, partial [Tetrabaena socialis]
VLPCPHGYRHSWTHCPFSHAGETARRRCPRQFSYLPDPCPHARAKRQCPNGDACPYAHSTFEQWLHPSRYRTRLCYLGANCKRATCFFAHSVEELRSNEENEGVAPHPAPGPMPSLPLPPPLPALGGLPYAVPASKPLSPGPGQPAAGAGASPAGAHNGGALHHHHHHLMCMPQPQLQQQQQQQRPHPGPPPPGAGLLPPPPPVGLLPGAMHHGMPLPTMMGGPQQQQQLHHMPSPMGAGMYMPRGMGPGAPQMHPHPGMGMGMVPSGSPYMSPGASPYMSSVYGAPYYQHPGDFQQPPAELGGPGRTRAWSTPGEAFLTAAGGPGAAPNSGPHSAGLVHNQAPRASDTGHYHPHHLHAPPPRFGAFASVPSPPYFGGRGAGGPVPRHMPAPTNRGPRRMSTPSSTPGAAAAAAAARTPSARTTAVGMVAMSHSPAHEQMPPLPPPPPSRPQQNDAVEAALRQLAFAASPSAGPPRQGDPLTPRSPTQIGAPPTHIAGPSQDASRRGGSSSDNNNNTFVAMLSAAGLDLPPPGDDAAAMPYHALLQHVLSVAAAAAEPPLAVAPSVQSGSGSAGGSNEHFDDAEEEEEGGYVERSSDPTPLNLRAAIHRMSEMGLSAAASSRNSDPGQTAAAAGSPAGAAMLLPLLQTLLNEGLATGQFELVGGQLQMRGGGSAGAPMLPHGVAASSPVAAEPSGSPLRNA